MEKKLQRWGLACLMCLVATMAKGQEATITWAFDTGEDGQQAAFSPEGTGGSFRTNYVTLGTNLYLNGTRTLDGVTYSKINPYVQDNGPDNATNAVEFTIVPMTGCSFIPRSVSFLTYRDGTDGGNLDISWFNSDGTSVSLETGLVPNRNNGDPNHTECSYDLSAAMQSDGACGLRVNIYALGDTKQVGLANIVVEGEIVSSLESFDNEAATAAWAFDTGEDGQAAAFSPDGMGNHFKSDYVSIGPNLYFNGTRTLDDITFSKINPYAQDNGPDNATNAVEFTIVPKTGLTFTPTSVSLDAYRDGTDGGKLDISWFNSDGTSVTLDTGQVPNRNNATPAHSEYAYDVTGAKASDGACGLRVNIYSLGDTKQVGLANIVINGLLDGEEAAVAMYTLEMLASPEGAGTLRCSPVGTIFDEGTVVTLDQARSFGYELVNWTDQHGNVLSTDESCVVTMDEDKTITANYAAIDTYALTVNVTEGAKDYMVSYDPEPNVVDGKDMFETGTSVKLTASSNKILTFASWSTGETSSSITVRMDGDKTVDANYTAVDYIAGWDFYLSGNSGRLADFAAEDNDDVALVLRDEDGNTTSWLDKSQEADGGYEGKPAAVNWKTDGLGKYYWQTRVNATAFTDLVVSSAMLYNYNAYTKYDVEYSLDGEDWNFVGSFELGASKTWYSDEFSLPSAANNQPAVYIRWIADKSSEISGTSSSNDGISIAEIFILATEELVDDGTPPELVSTVPEEGATTASANGRIVLTFDEKVKVKDGTTATLNDMALSPTVSGKTVMFEYKGLEYSTPYTFTLPGGSVSDLTDNAIDRAITINFTTKTRPTVDKRLYDFVVPDDGTITEAFAAAEARDNTGERFYIFVRQGDYVIPASETATVTGTDGKAYPSPVTTLGVPNVSIIGEDMDLTTIANTVPSTLVDGANAIEGLGNCETFSFSTACTDIYMQDITIRNSLADGTGRGAALEDSGDRNVCKNVCLYGYQDTYYSRQSNRYYFEGGRLRGRTDFLCGRGDIFFNNVEIVMCASGGYVTAPSVSRMYGYIFKDCTITGGSDVNSKYYLGRPWGTGTPICLWIDTRMEVQPYAEGWTNMSTDNYPSRFAEYNSMTSSGTTIDLSNRRTSFGSGNHPNNPVLTAEEASIYTVETVMGGDDDWNPLDLTEQASAPTNVELSDYCLTWDDNDYVLCWAVCKDGKVTGFTTTPEYMIDDYSATWTVRAANEMGGLGEAAPVGSSGIEGARMGEGRVTRTDYYDIGGARVGETSKGIVIRVDSLEDGSRVVTKVIR